MPWYEVGLISDLNHTKEWVKKQGFKGAFVFIGIYIIATICFIPGSLLTLGAGFIFRPLYYGIIVVWIGASIGCFCSFLLGRYALRSWVAEKVTILRTRKFTEIY